MHVYTLIQLFGLAILYIVSYRKSIALAFPFVVLLMLPLRFSLKYLRKISITRKGLVIKGNVFTEAELEAVSIHITFYTYTYLHRLLYFIIEIIHILSFLFNSLTEKMLGSLYEMKIENNVTF